MASVGLSKCETPSLFHKDTMCAKHVSFGDPWCLSCGCDLWLIVASCMGAVRRSRLWPTTWKVWERYSHVCRTLWRTIVSLVSEWFSTGISTARSEGQRNENSTHHRPPARQIRTVVGVKCADALFWTTTSNCAASSEKCPTIFLMSSQIFVESQLCSSFGKML